MNIVVVLGVIITLLTGLPVLLQLMRNHPRGLIVLFFAEMWERFSYYGMRAILIFYLTQHLLFDTENANAQYGSYTSLVYLLPLIGGILADRYLGTRKAVAFGALLLVAGHLAMAVEGEPTRETLTYAGQAYELSLEGRMDDREVRLMVQGEPYAFGAAPGGGLQIIDLPTTAPLPSVLPAGSYEMTQTADPVGVNVFYLAVSLIILGVGFLKPNISTIVGQLYPQGDPRRDSGFTLYYYGINLGAFWASVLCGLLGQHFGWGYGFGLAGIGMALGWIVFVLGKPLLEGKGEPPNPELLAKPVVGPVNREWLIYLATLPAIGAVWWLVQRNAVVGWVLSVAIVLSLIIIAYVILRVCQTKVERQRMMLATVLIFGSVVFWTLFEQAGTSLNLFAARNVDLSVTQSATSFLGIPMGSPEQLAAAGVATDSWWGWIDSRFAAAQVQSFNAGFILIFAPIFAALWAFLGRRGMDPDPTMKFGLGLLQAGLGFMVVVWGAGLADDSFRVPLMLLGLLYLLHTTGELFLSPVGLSEITKLSLASVVSFMMAVWFLSSAIAQYVGGWIAGLAGTATLGGQVLDPAAALRSSLEVFQMLGYWGLAAGAVFIVLSFFIKGWAHGVETGHGPSPEPIAPTVDGERQAVNPQTLRDDR
ncbi:peptide MFS transporter [Phenylobacterium sp.]|jgi:POT family proton-dependent oligopeptide transporter|uniref:peptide MFS transporter n=1 Tax=Phenylobacterium sp. TaxID=1871053 RepID=UPI000C8901EB|nr:oligopeptide:H+ symporter [Phenylobacterium sp.]MAK81209.1 MFS transporter [Phenylobacterium sp.]|tara:strand:- start:29094 stop:31037 length:1944 start_codon:yes stop_codon:yes gene_type:complete